MLNIIIAIAIVFLFGVFFLNKRKPANSPPGPLCLPVIGSAWALGTNPGYIHVALTKLAQKWGPIYQLMVVQQPFIVITDPEIMKEAFSGSDPPVLLRYVNKPLYLMDEGKSIFFATDRHHWAVLRKMCAPIIRNMPGGVPIPQIITGEITKLFAYIDKNLNKGIYLNSMFSIFTRNVFLQILCRESWSFDKLSEEQVQYFKTYDRALELVSSPLEFIPALDFLRSRVRKEFLQCVAKLDSYQHKLVQQRVQDGAATSIDTTRDFLDILILEMQQNQEISELDVVRTLKILAIASVATVSDSLDWMLLFLCTHPDIQEKCYTELNNYLKGRQPLLEDQVNLPYLDSVIKETFRLRPSAPIGFMHLAERDCIIGGYHVAKGTVVIPNYFGIGNMDKHFPNSSEFDPDRWTRNPELASNLILFGLGPASCLGMPIAKQEMFLTAASMLQKYKFEVAPSSPTPNLLGEFKFTYNPNEWHTLVSLR